jgi:hypothetical protein
MSMLIKDYVEVGTEHSLDALIARLIEVRDSLPADAEANVRMRGDDAFGRHLSISFMRPLNGEEADCVSRYGNCPVKLRRVA